MALMIGDDVDCDDEGDLKVYYSTHLSHTTCFILYHNALMHSKDYYVEDVVEVHTQNLTRPSLDYHRSCHQVLCQTVYSLSC